MSDWYYGNFSWIFVTVSRGYFKEALSLAEKYRDFDILVEICEENHDQDKLQHYMTLFNNEVTIISQSRVANLK